MNVEKINGWIRTEAAVVFGGVAALFVCLLALAILISSHTADEERFVCYGIYGSSGRFYPSAQVPYFSGGLWYVITHENWHAVGDFEATFTDRECLRNKYPDDPAMVPDVEGVH